MLLLIGYQGISQIKGVVSDTNNNPLPFVNVYIENTYKGTTTNDDGVYELSINKPGSYTVIFQYLGYKTLKRTHEINEFPFSHNVVLEEESISLGEVIVNAEDNPANTIIRQAIAVRKENLEKINNYKADFYSRGLIRIKDAPEKILGQELGDLGGGLDSTRSGIIYLSETISKIEFLFPDNLKERITASKVSGNDNGFSFNNAIDVNYNLYNKTIELGNEIISPIANNAFNYYKYQLEGVFFDDRGNLINKIKVTPKRPNDPVFNGTIYIVEDQWTFYAIELEITGIQAKIPAADIIGLNQNFSYSERDNLWVLISQSIDFEYGIFGIKGDGRFTAVYSNYEFNLPVAKNNFGRELVSFAEEANKKDSLFWKSIRPVPLTTEEINDYVKKDSIQLVRKSKPYLDSVDSANNRFKLGNLLNGYTYQNSHKDIKLGYELPLSNIQFNTVQGYHGNLNLFFQKNYDQFRRYLYADVDINYGFSDDRLRPKAAITYKFNNISRPFLTLAAGVEAQQFNTSIPITPFSNTISSLFFEDNYMKLFENRYVQLRYSQEWFNGFRFFTNLSYEKRLPLFNSTDQVFINNENDIYTSNNPLDPLGFNTASFVQHTILKLYISTTINFGQRYLSYPDSKFNIGTDKYPTLSIGYEKGFASTIEDYNFDQLKLRVFQSFNIANKGRLNYNIRLGKFLNGDNIAFMDYQHFNGNEVHVSRRGNYTDVFNNLEYYRLSTNDSYLEAHIEHDFNGYILGKIPLLNKLNFNLIVGTHALSLPNNKPYQEYTIGLDNIGWGKFRFLRFDYVRSYQGGFLNDTVVFGLRFFN
ncbi:MAG: carboxypeptidase-like regulatory domain-containing protein [Winogradskyella sp.]|nr:carboxypeptidase-like regulatory domain-containing protein [Winogradskyella sp.]